MNIQIPELEHKYINLYDTQEEYEADKSRYEEVNYSIVKSPEATEDNYSEYQYSTRTTNNDNEVMAKYWPIEQPNVYAGLEIIWGYFGWEWIDFEWNGEPLKGGNFYQVKPMTVVKSIPDGNRLQHINNFLYNLHNINEVEYFDTSNIKYLYRIFNLYGRNTTASQTFNCKINTFQNCEYVEEFISNTFYSFTSSSLYRYTLLSFPDNVINLPNVTTIKNFYISAYADSIIPINAPKLQRVEGFANKICKYSLPEITLNINDLIRNATSLEYLDFIRQVDQNGSSNIDVTLVYNIDTTKDLTIQNLISDTTTFSLNLQVTRDSGNSTLISYGNIINAYSLTVYEQYINQCVIPTSNIKFIDTEFISNMIFTCTPPILTIDPAIIDNADSSESFCLYKDCHFQTDDTIFNFNYNNELSATNYLFQNATFTGNGKFINLKYLNDINISCTLKEDYTIDEDLTAEDLIYSNRGLCINSNFTSIKEQEIDIFYYSGRTILESDIADFTDNDFTINIKNTDVEYTNSLSFFHLPNCRITPILTGDITYLQRILGDIVIDVANSIVEDIRLDNLNVTLLPCSNNYPVIDTIVIYSKNLIYFRIGRIDASLDLKVCKNLDIPTFKNSIMKQVPTTFVTYDSRTLDIRREVYSALDEETITHMLEVYNVINIYEDENT